eukprot:CAMPEP_0181124678 /NCGR_PEP_ID=MMETSP1071-20121207/26617_1 /TAXON_ID=35127 /ORGANISM="Thalassiosira sp., Strain NH16" /LENGTH=206 /DNA_ID=CAMNT_0023210015 /DNA_START=31 /DNA_END=651 /DNA_ORIENTATION=-
MELTSIALFIVSALLSLQAIPAFSLSSTESISRREVGKSIIGSGACLTSIVGGFAPPSLAAGEEEYTTSDRGIKYAVTMPPSDPSSHTPVRGQKVEAKYTLYLNGFPDDTAQAKKVDSSKGPFGEKPFKFVAGVGQVIKGWDVSILDMHLGEARKLVIPAELGYGAKGTGPIPGGAVLYFNVELTDIGAEPNFNADQENWLAEHPL